MGGGAGTRSSLLERLNSKCLLDLHAETSAELGIVQTGDINMGLVSK